MNPFLKLLRVKGWYAYLGIAILGFVMVQGFLSQLVDVIVFFLMVAAYLGFSFAINDSYDVREDSINHDKKNPIATAEVEQRDAILFSAALGIVGLLLSMWFGPLIFLYQLTLTILSFFYSAPPLRLKSRFPFDLVSHGFFFGALIFMFPIVVFGPATNSLSILTVSIFIFSLLLELWNHISDFESDLKAKLRTTVVVLGLERSEKVTMALSLLFPITLLPFYYSNGYLLLFCFGTLLYSLLIAWKRDPAYLFSYANLYYGFIGMLVILPYIPLDELVFSLIPIFFPY